ncbi:MAG: CHAT domain-containing protein [Phycisphaerales bacterium]
MAPLPATDPAATPPGGLSGGAPPGVPPSPWSRLTVSRTRQHRLDLHLANCSITDVEARAYVVGIFREVTPVGAAKAIDARLGGAITELMQRRMFSGGVGEVFVLPATRLRLPTDLVVFVGLGYFDDFNDAVVQAAAENTMRTFVRTRVEEFATVLLGAGSGKPVAKLVENLLRGFLRGKLDTDANRRFRRIVLCENDKPRYDEICAEVYRLASTPLFDEVEMCLTEEALVQAPSVLVPGELLRGARDEAHATAPAYLQVRSEGETRGVLRTRSSLLTAGATAAVVTESFDVRRDDILRLLRPITDDGFTGENIAGFGEQIAKLLLHPRIVKFLGEMKGRHLVIVHDSDASRIPWEAIRVGGWTPALDMGISRRYMADNLSIAKYLETRVDDGRLDVLTVVNPTQDLKNAQQEYNQIRDILAALPDVRLDPVIGAEATRPRVLAELQSGRHDVVHYAGHAFFDPERRLRSGLICAGEEPESVLTGVDLATVSTLPSLIVFNACETGRVRGARATAGAGRKPRASPAITAGGLAEALLRGGVANYVGTYWPVGDKAASDFATSFYRALLDRKTMGEAVVDGRRAIGASNADWANYMHYGDYSFVLRR